jgi:hypothetical protein
MSRFIKWFLPRLPSELIRPLCYGILYGIIHLECSPPFHLAGAIPYPIWMAIDLCFMPPAPVSPFA